MKIDEFQHPDSIWTWKSNARGGRASLWIPYLNTIEKLKGYNWRLSYNGGELDVNLDKVDTILLYGGKADLPIEFLDQLGTKRIPMLIHRRNMASPTLVTPSARPASNDILGKQIPLRMNQTKCATVARTLVRCRFRSLEPSFCIPSFVYSKLNKLRSVDDIRNFEAYWSREYWGHWFASVGLPEQTRRSPSPATAALDACSFFLSGIILRWILLHKMSPHHGFLHRPTAYPSLVYDLIEPYRYLIEDAVAKAIQNRGPQDPKLTSCALSVIKDDLKDTVYVPATRQWVRRKNLLHGVVLSLRAWLCGDMKRLVIPMEGAPKGGRPLKVSYKLPGGRKKGP